MIVPNRHSPDMQRLTDAELVDLQKTTVKMIDVLKKCLKPSGFNVGMNLGQVAGAGIDKHMHIHIVPRWKSDTNFMPVISDTKIVSQSLGDLYKLIIKNLKK
jgi:ATP adenylyltransferase